MKAKDNPEISHAEAELNSAPAFGDAIQSFVRPLIQSALEGPSMPGPCTWLRNGNSDPPGESKPEGLAALPTPQIDQIENSTPSVSDLPEDGKPPLSGNGIAAPAALEFLRGVLLSKSFIEFVADAAVAKVLAAQAQTAEAIDSSDECEVVTSLYFVHEPGGPIASAHFDSDREFCRALRVALNVANRVVNAYVSKGEMHSVKYLCGKAIARLVLRQQQTPFEAAVLALLLTMINRAPNARISEDQLAVGLTRSPLLARLPELLSNGQLVPGRSFSLSRFKVFTPKQNLGNPWGRSKGRR